MSLDIQHFYEYRTPAGALYSLDVLETSGGREENTVGTLEMTLPGNIYDVDDFAKDGEIYIWRSVGGGPRKLLGDTFWFVTPLRRHQTEATGDKRLYISCSDPIKLIDRRIVAYYGGNTYTEKANVSDDFLKEIMRENYGASAVDTTRDLSERLSIQADFSLGAAITDTIQWKDIESVFNNACEQSWGYNYRLLYDFIYTGYGKLRFCTYIGYRGVDHSSDSGDPITVSDEDGSLVEGYYEYDESDEYNSVYVGGRGYEDRRSVQNQQDSARIAQSFWGLKEKFCGEVNTTSVSKINDAAVRELSKGRPVKRMGGRIVQRENTVFGVDYGYGDLLSMKYNRRAMDGRISAFSWTWNQQSGEDMQVYGHGEQYA